MNNNREMENSDDEYSDMPPLEDAIDLPENSGIFLISRIPSSNSSGSPGSTTRTSSPDLGEDYESTYTFDDRESRRMISRIAGLLAINRMQSSGSPIFHTDCSICHQYENAVINHVQDRGINTHDSSHEETRGILRIAEEIWLEHLVESYQDYLRERERAREIMERSMDEAAPPPKRATEEEIFSLETGIYNLKDTLSCCICLNDIEEGEKFTKTYCSHFFHKDCVERWLKENVKCPVCRRNSITGEIIDEP